MAAQVRHRPGRWGALGVADRFVPVAGPMGAGYVGLGAEQVSQMASDAARRFIVASLDGDIHDARLKVELPNGMASGQCPRPDGAWCKKHDRGTGRLPSIPEAGVRRRPPSQIHLSLGELQRTRVAGGPVELHQGSLDLWVATHAHNSSRPPSSREKVTRRWPTSLVGHVERNLGARPARLVRHGGLEKVARQ